MSEPGEPLADRRAPAPVSRRERVYQGRVWDVVSEDFTLDGVGSLTRDLVDHPGAAAVVALDEENRVFLIQQYRHPIGTYEWELPAGLLDVEGEPPLECAQRELVEEGDLRAEHWSPLVSYHSSPGGMDEVLHLFVARGLSQVPDDERHERTAEEAGMPTRWVPVDEVVDAILEGRVRNGTLTIGVLAVAEKLRRGTLA